MSHAVVSARSPSPRRGCWLGFAVLPILWWLLRVTPPAPRRVRFPALRLLLGLVPREETPAKTPLWLILLRMAAGVAHHPRAGASAAQSLGAHRRQRAAGARGRQWLDRRRGNGTSAAPRSTRLIDQAEREGRRIVLLDTAPPAGIGRAAGICRCCGRPTRAPRPTRWRPRRGRPIADAALERLAEARSRLVADLRLAERRHR